MNATEQQILVEVAKKSLQKLVSGEWEAASGVRCRGNRGCFISLTMDVQHSLRQICCFGNEAEAMVYFEGWDARVYLFVPQWMAMFPTYHDRLVAILQNIIRNAGTFVPSDIQPIETAAPPAFGPSEFKKEAASQPTGVSCSA
jgi:hypothetical protein